MEKLISVIVPIYKVKEYLERCIESIVNQTYQNLEIILVDDGSPDSCPVLCDNWKKKDDRIKVIHKKNGGLSDARNEGMKIATGDYISFVDSDDWIGKEMYHCMVQALENYDADICECNYLKTDKMQHTEEMIENNFQLLDNMEALEKLLKEEVAPVVWNKIYKREIMIDLFFKVGKYNEDEFWTYLALDQAEKIVKIDTVLYYYFYREDSIIHETYSIKRLDGLEARFERMNYLKKYPRLNGLAKRNLVFECMYHYQKGLEYLEEKELQILKIRVNDIFRRTKLTLKEVSKYVIKEKIWYFCGRISLDITCKIRNKLGYGI